MSNITLPLDIKSLEITSQTLDAKGNIILDAVSNCSETTCHKCGKPATKRDGYSTPIMVEHTKILEKKVYLSVMFHNVALLISPSAQPISLFLGGSVALWHAKACHFIDHSTTNNGFLFLTR